MPIKVQHLPPKPVSSLARRAGRADVDRMEWEYQARDALQRLSADLQLRNALEASQRRFQQEKQLNTQTHRQRLDRAEQQVGMEKDLKDYAADLEVQTQGRLWDLEDEYGRGPEAQAEREKAIRKHIYETMYGAQEDYTKATREHGAMLEQIQTNRKLRRAGYEYSPQQQQHIQGLRQDMDHVRENLEGEERQQALTELRKQIDMVTPEVKPEPSPEEVVAKRIVEHNGILYRIDKDGVPEPLDEELQPQNKIPFKEYAELAGQVDKFYWENHKRLPSPQEKQRAIQELMKGYQALNSGEGLPEEQPFSSQPQFEQPEISPEKRKEFQDADSLEQRFFQEEPKDWHWADSGYIKEQAERIVGKYYQDMRDAGMSHEEAQKLTRENYSALRSKNNDYPDISVDEVTASQTEQLHETEINRVSTEVINGKMSPVDLVSQTAGHLEPSMQKKFHAAVIATLQRQDWTPQQKRKKIALYMQKAQQIR